MSVEFLVQPNGDLRLGDYLIAELGNPIWAEFRAAVAFVKQSGTQHLAGPLEQFDERGAVRISVGIDLLGTSREALEDLLHSVNHGEIWVFHNTNQSSTFHPKLYLFKNNSSAKLIVGSGNWTQGGLFMNYEACAAVLLDPTIPEDVAALSVVEGVLNSWSHEQHGLCHRLTTGLLEQLVQMGLVRSEAQINAAAAALSHLAPQPDAGAGLPPELTALFHYVAVPGAPPVPAELAAVLEPPEIAIEPAVGNAQVMATAALPAIALGGYTRFVMTLQNTDVGVGQITPGTTRRSPEVFIPLAAIDANPAFWRFPASFTPDDEWNAAHPQHRRNGLGKLDRTGVPMRVGVLQHVNIFFNPQKKDFRLRHEALRSSGHVGDIMLITTLDPASGYEYDVQVAPHGTALFDELEQHCTTAVPNSLKHFGDF